LLGQVKLLACQFYVLTNKPLGVTGEIAEYEAAEKLRLKLSTARNPGFDASRKSRGRNIRYQIKGRAVSTDDKYRGRVSRIARNSKFDEVLLVLLDKRSLNAVEIWQASRRRVLNKLKGSSKAKKRGSLAIRQFKSVANRIWPANAK
jgi:hypothetical protein